MAYRPYPNVDRALRQVFRAAPEMSTSWESARQAFLAGEAAYDEDQDSAPFVGEYVLSTRRAPA